MTEKRIFVVVAQTVDTPEKGVVVQVPGRMAAQGGHALARARMHHLLDRVEQAVKQGLPTKKLCLADWRKMVCDEKITTIWKACRDSRELEHVLGLLDKVKVEHYGFEDENDDIYGAEFHPCTALATVPVDPDKLIGVTDYLPLWKPEDFR